MSKKVHNLTNEPKTTNTPKEDTPKKYYVKVSRKIKAFIVDSFMLLMPIMYVVFYLVFDGREGFASQRLLGWLYILIPLVMTQWLFFVLHGQTPGYKAYSLHIVDSTTGEKPSNFILFFRSISTLLSFFTFIGWSMMFFRKDTKTLHDLLTRTVVIYQPVEE